MESFPLFLFSPSAGFISQQPHSLFGKTNPLFLSDLQPSSATPMPRGFTRCPRAVFIVPFTPGSHGSPAGISGAGGNRRGHNAFLPSPSPNSPRIGRDLDSPPRGWHGLGRAFPRHSSPLPVLGDQKGSLPPTGQCQPLAPTAPIRASPAGTAPGSACPGEPGNSPGLWAGLRLPPSPEEVWAPGEERFRFWGWTPAVWSCMSCAGSV